MEELYTFVKNIEIPTFLDATHVSNMMPIFGYLPKDREKILDMLQQGTDWMGENGMRKRRDNVRHL